MYHIYMKLEKEDAELFFRLMWSLLAYVNQELKLSPKILLLEKVEELPFDEMLELRDGLYDNIHLIDSYIKENPDRYSEDELEIIKNWKKFKRGDYFIERYLKKYAIFIDGKNVYAVLGLYESFEELIPREVLPRYVKAVLLPFKGKIIFDGMMEGYRMTFGSGMKFDLKETYMAAKVNDKIIRSLEPRKTVEVIKRKKKPIKDWSPLVAEMSEKAKKMRASSGAPAIQGPTFSVLRASLEFSELALKSPDDFDALWKAIKKIDRALDKAARILERLEYYHHE